MFNNKQELVYEDFYPYSDNEALFVCGPSYTHLNKIVFMNYEINKIILTKNFENLVEGIYLRLGNYFKNELIYSDNYEIYKNGKFLYEGIQPYMFDKGLLYQHHGVIFLNDEIIIKPPFTQDYLVVGRPSYYNGFVYYETRNLPAPNWEIWRYDLSTNKEEFIINGANPFLYNDILFYSKWNGKKFDLFFQNNLNNIKYERYSNVTK